ncbi:hypothetical protein [Fibrobacter sp. UWB13]|uniref:hypothetical protein n=1 Tax=Fibrobacter sp. UWB13 TaxID=1896204 RepID=UPI000A0D988E|nr:hypothetical protein [Fibrobacter sp. UWB13]SMG34764.1 hypothetical protein SAMN05720489_2416 [Fibrobacter sp. UWB13]
MKYTLLTAVSSAFLIAACSDSNPSSASNDSSTNSASNNDPNSATGTLYVDESQHLMVTTFTDVHGNRCDLENDNLIWKTITKNAIIDSFEYEFIGDTLVLYDYYEGGADNYGKLYVGGTAGNIYGSWVYTGIERNRKTGEEEHSTNTRYVTRTYTYAPGKVTINLEYHMDLYVADEQERGYMESSFMVELYGYLARRSHMDDVINIMDNEDLASSIARSIENNGVQIIEGTKTNQTFKIGDKTYTVTVKKAETTLHYSGRTNREAIVEVSDGTTTCSSYAIYKNVDENLCKTENLEYFTVKDDEDEDGNKYFYVSRYKNTDHEQFLKCLSGIALPITEAQ